MAQFNLTITLEYALVSASHQLPFVEEVNRWIDEGWQPIGGAFVYEGDFYQAMARENPEKQYKYNPDLRINL